MIDIIIEKLEKCRRSGHARYIACCPAHDDKSPSLSVRAVDGKILIHCHAGCEPDAVLAALGLRWSDVFEDEWDAAYHAAISQTTKMPRIDPLEHERTILFLADEQLERGDPLSIEDEARVKLAIERLEAISD